MSFFNELQRRNVVRVGVAYTLIAWVIAQVAEFAFENFGAPEWAIKSLVVLMLLGLPLVLVFAWIYEMTPEGLKREQDVDRSTSITPHTGRRIDRVIIGALVIALGFFAADKYLWRSSPADMPAAAPAAETAPAPDTAPSAEAGSGAPDKSVAVLPFVAMSDGPDDEFFADGLTEEILNSLAQLPELLVTARTSAFVFKGDDLPPIPEIAERLGVQHVVEGSVRRSGERLRVTAQLIRANDGFHLWSENYDSTEADTIQVQENIAEKIAVSLDVVLDEEKSEAMRKAGLRDIEAFMAYQKGLQQFDAAHGEIEMLVGLRTANQYFDKVVERAPQFAQVYGLRADLYVHLMNEDVFAGPASTLDDEEVLAAYPAAVENYEAAVRYAQDRDDQVQAELDLAFTQGTWRGLRTRGERALAIDRCDDGNWMTTVVNPLGLAAAYLPRAERVLACDPLRSISWFNVARANLWAGNYDEAVRVAREGMEVARGGWLEWIYGRTLIESGRFDEAEVVIDTQVRSTEWVEALRVLMAAKRGDAAGVEEALGALSFDPDTQIFGVLFNAWSGRREDANRLAARYDAHPWGQWALWQATHWCACGHPFDLEAAPNFARAIEESGLPWPPASRDYPLKDW
jgi:TolB-like protein/tetratricopeptide (TPR) repeat protein